jgi:hypothetical protein
MGSPKTADEADDSYRTLGVGRSVPRHHYCLQASVVGECSNGARLSALACAGAFAGGLAMRALLTNYGFTVSVLVGVAITAIFAFVFDAPLPLVEAMLALGFFTALIEHFLRSDEG